MTEETSGNGSMVAIVAIVVLAGLAVVFFVYGLPMLQKNSAQPQQPGTTVDIKLPTDTTKPAEPAPTP
mgnify:CR=1 FL=1